MTPVTIELLERHGDLRGPRLPRFVEPLWEARRVLWRELLGFRFDYPLEAVQAAGSRESLHYYIYSEHLFFGAMELDPQGIPLQRSRIFGKTYNAAYIAWYGLVSLARFLRGLDPAGSRTFMKQVNWLETHAVRRNDDALVWPYTVDWQEGHCVLKAPWISAMAQGLAMSALVRGYRMTGQAHLLDLCCRATLVFEKNVEDGGVRTLEQGRPLYEEYPGYPLPRVLDGFLFSLLGLYDLAIQIGDTKAFQLFTGGMNGLKHTLEFWNHRDKWSWYGSHGYLCPPHYHKLNSALLLILGRLSGEPALIRYAESWSSTRLSLLDKLEIFSVFALTKNWARVRYRWGVRRSARSSSSLPAPPVSRT